MAKLSVERTLRKAISHERNGQMDEARKCYDSILELFPGNIRAKQGLVKLSQPKTDTSAEENPSDEILHQLIAAYNKGQISTVTRECDRLIKEFPQSFLLWNLLGAANNAQGKLEEAIAAYKKAIQLRPNFAEAHKNLAVTFSCMGNSEAAIESCKQALKIKPDYAEAHFQMGIALDKTGSLEAAINSYKQAIKIKPDYAEAHNNIAVAFNDMGNPEAAIDSCKQALKIRPDHDNAYINIGVALKRVRFTKPETDLQEIIVSLLSRKNLVRPQEISRAGISLLKLEPVIKELFQKHSAGDLNHSFEKLASSLQDIPLLLKLMSVCPLPDLEFEAGLTAIRSALLLSVSEITDSPEVLVFQSALALQCFINEYIYNQTSEEAELLRRLELSINSEISNGKKPSPHSILCLASYKALHDYEWGNLISLTTDIEDVFAQQILEPRQENYLKSEMPILDDITDKVSSKVRKQYEKNPYPRWVHLGLRKNPTTVSNLVDELNLRTFNNGINEVESPAILVAGCGTGQHSISTATRFLNSKVLAVDLSLSSLAYAKRKTEELGLQNIEYMQADILDLGKLDKQFEIVESQGVLHHMNDPIAGWKVLSGRLNLGGLMSIGLYSELARKHIVALRDNISQNNIGSDDDAMKSFRRGVINSEDKEECQRIKLSLDFYSLSEVRDLLFHVQEHQFTLPQIQDCLSQLGLQFCGFEDAKIVHGFKRTNIGPDDPYDLIKWNSYEEANPRTFAGMYQFWCQKVS